MTWQSKKTMMSPVAASPHRFFAPISPSVASWRTMRTLYAAASGKVGASGRVLPSSTTFDLRANVGRRAAEHRKVHVGRMKRCSIAHGSTTLSVSSGRDALRVYASVGS